MNERIRELALQADLIRYKSEEINQKIEKFAELIVRACAGQCLSDDCMRILNHFGVEESKGWVCSKCQIDRTIDICPLGPSASLDGRCPCVISAQSS